MTDEEIDELAMKKWEDQDNLEKILKKDLNTINCKCFNGKLPKIEIDIAPMWVSRGLFGERVAMGEYRPQEDSYSARITIFTCALLEDNIRFMAISHEMIHHWEFSNPEAEGIETYPAEVESLVTTLFKTEYKRQHWCSAHSPRFCYKAIEVSKILNLPLTTLLFNKNL